MVLKSSFDLSWLDGWAEYKTVKIHRVTQNSNTSASSSTSNCSKVLLLHGTKVKNVDGILKTGFKLFIIKQLKNFRVY